MGKCSAHLNIPLSPRCARTLPFGRAGRGGPYGARRRADAACRSASRGSSMGCHENTFASFGLARARARIRTRGVDSICEAIGPWRRRPTTIYFKVAEIGPTLEEWTERSLAARTGLSNSWVARLRCRLAGCCIRSPRSRLASPLRSQNSQRLLRKATGPCHRGEIAYSTEERFP
jgi:hypothetical protein